MGNSESSIEYRAATVRTLAEAVSVQARIANRAWLVLIGVALVILIPRSASNDPNVGFALPLGIGPVDPGWFLPVSFLIVAVLSIAFCTAHAQALRAVNLAHRAINDLGDAAVAPGDIHPRDYFDMLRQPSISRVAPLAQLLRMRYQFFPEAKRCPTWLKRASAGYYLLLKIVASLVYLVVPGLALVHAFMRLQAPVPLVVLFAFIGGIAGVALIHTFAMEVQYVLDTTTLIGRARA